MLFNLDFIEASQPWRKTIIKRGQSLEINNPRPSWRVTSYREEANDLRTVYKRILHHAERGRGLLRGNLKKPLDDEPRAGKVDANARTRLLVFDVDGTRTTDDPHEFMTGVLGLPDTNAIYIYTSSYKVKDGLRFLALVPLSEAQPWQRLKDLVWWLQVSNPLLAAETRLDVSGSVLVPPIDPASSIPSQVYTITPPKFVPSSLDPFKGQPLARYVYHEGRLPNLDIIPLLPKDRNDIADAKSALLTQLRAESGYSTRSAPDTQTSVESDGSEWTLVRNPPPAEVTEVKDCGRFVRLNLNGGDSEAYWHPKDKLTYLYSFKGMVKYPMEKIVPEYYATQVQQRRDETERRMAEAVSRPADNETPGEAPVPMVVVEESTEEYLCFELTAETTWRDVVRFYKRTSAISWLSTLGYDTDAAKNPIMMRSVFDPSMGFLDVAKRRINRFTPPDEPHTLEEPATKENIPPQFLKLVRHVLGDDESMVESFLDWLAFVYQRRCPPHSAWLLHGTTGTGKDLTWGILRRVFGQEYCKSIMPHQLVENFNAWVEDTNLVFVNEIDSRVFQRTNLTARLNDYITADKIAVRRMRQDLYEIRNFAAYIFTSNRMDAIELPPNDRRFHVPPRQESKLITVMGQDEIDFLVNPPESFIYDLRAWFRARVYDEERVRRPVLTEAKITLADASQPAAQRVVGYLRSGSWEELVKVLDPVERVMNVKGLPDEAMVLSDMFLSIVRHAETARTGHVPVSMTELRALFAVTCDRDIAQMAPAKFRQWLLHQGLHEADRSVVKKRLKKSIRGVVFPVPRLSGMLDRMREHLISLGYLPKPNSGKVVNLDRER